MVLDLATFVVDLQIIRSGADSPGAAGPQAKAAPSATMQIRPKPVRGTVVAISGCCRQVRDVPVWVTARGRLRRRS
jgi:hypothetical protein